MNAAIAVLDKPISSDSTISVPEKHHHSIWYVVQIRSLYTMVYIKIYNPKMVEFSYAYSLSHDLKFGSHPPTQNEVPHSNRMNAGSSIKRYCAEVMVNPLGFRHTL